MSNTLGSQIKKMRLDRGITQAALAKATGISVQAVSKWECGGTPDVGLLPVIAGFFNVTIDELFGRSVTDVLQLDNLVFDEIQRAPESLRLKRSGDVCWALFKAVSGIPNMRDVDFASGADDQTSCTRGRVTFDTGLAYVSALNGAQSYFFFPEPEKGYAAALASGEMYARLFALLSDPGTMEALLFLHRRNAVPFSLEHLAKALALEHEQAESILRGFKEFGWIEEEIVELDSGVKTLYRPNLTEAFLGFLYFAKEIMHKIKLWYMSNNARVKPLL